MNPSAFEVSLVGISSHEVDSPHCPQSLLQVSGMLYETKRKKESKKKERKTKKVVPREKKKIHIKYPEYVMLLYRTDCVIVRLAVWVKYRRSSVLRPLCCVISWKLPCEAGRPHESHPEPLETLTLFFSKWIWIVCGYECQTFYYFNHRHIFFGRLKKSDDKPHLENV